MLRAEALGTILPLKGVAGAVVAVKHVFHTRALERRLVIVHVLGRRILILIAENPDDGARDVPVSSMAGGLPSPRTSFTPPP